ncbi:MAG TPA: SMC-Scp complex subunit ScpB [Terracidiphilus sp.]|nr:SMC-Scp complex subunit ScpB [Terracidiphilus sp.]
MSLKAKLEAVIYAAEEPVTLAQLATLFAAEALEWRAAQQAAAAEQTAEMAGQLPENAEGLPLLKEDLEALGMNEVEVGAEVEAGAEGDPAQAEPAPAIPGTSTEEGAAPQAEPRDTESGAEPEARRAARQREREVRSVIKQLLDELIAAYASDASGLEIREIAGGYRMATKPEYHDAVRVFVRSLKPPLKLSLPALETLAVVAYKQPVTSPEVSEIRGVESGGVLGSLLSRKLIATAGRKQVIGRPILYKTTKEFLVRFGLKDLTELPSMEEFEKMAAAEIEEEMEPEAVAADAAEDQADAAAEAAGESLLEENGPSGVELAGEAAEAAAGDGAHTSEFESLSAGNEESAGATPDGASATSNGPEETEDRVAEDRK